MRLPPGRARAFEAAGKQGCACVAWSRKRRTGFISRQGVYESPRRSSPTGLWDKVSQTDNHTHEKADGFFSQNRHGREAILGLCYLPDKRELFFILNFIYCCFSCIRYHFLITSAKCFIVDLRFSQCQTVICS